MEDIPTKQPTQSFSKQISWFFLHKSLNWTVCSRSIQPFQGRIIIPYEG